MTDITVIIPSKDRLWSLPRAVSSCRSSRLKVEIIVVDDGSADGTGDWLRSQPDVIAIRGEGWGKPWGVNKALSMATGAYLRYLDSDDWLNPGANELQFDVAIKENADVVVSGYDFYKGDEFAEAVPWVPTDDFVAQQLGETPGSHYSAFLFRRDFVADVPHRTLFPASDFASRDDRCFILEVALRRPRIAVSPGAALCHRYHDNPRLQFRGGLGGLGTNIQTLYIVRHILRLLEGRGALTARRISIACKDLWSLAHAFAYSHLDDACDIVREIYALDPDFQPPETGLLGLLYRKLGFRATEKILQARRVLLRGLGLPKR